MEEFLSVYSSVEAYYVFDNVSDLYEIRSTCTIELTDQHIFVATSNRVFTSGSMVVVDWSCESDVMMYEHVLPVHLQAMTLFSAGATTSGAQDLRLRVIEYGEEPTWLSMGYVTRLNISFGYEYAARILGGRRVILDTMLSRQNKLLVRPTI